MSTEHLRSLGAGTEQELEDTRQRNARTGHSYERLSPGERLPSADRSQQIIHTAGRHRDSAARLCSIFRLCSFPRAATRGELKEHLRAAESHIKLDEEVCLAEDDGNTIALAPGESQPDWRKSFYLPSQNQASRF